MIFFLFQLYFNFENFRVSGSVNEKIFKCLPYGNTNIGKKIQEIPIAMCDAEWCNCEFTTGSPSWRIKFM